MTLVAAKQTIGISMRIFGTRCIFLVYSNDCRDKIQSRCTKNERFWGLRVMHTPVVVFLESTDPRPRPYIIPIVDRTGSVGMCTVN